MVAQRPSGEPTFRGGPRFRRAARGFLSPRRSRRHERAPAGHGRARGKEDADEPCGRPLHLSLIHISEPTRLGMISYAVFCLKKKKKKTKKKKKSKQKKK